MTDIAFLNLILMRLHQNAEVGITDTKEVQIMIKDRLQEIKDVMDGMKVWEDSLK